MTSVAAVVAVAAIGVLAALAARSSLKRRTTKPGSTTPGRTAPGRTTLSWQLVCASVMLVCAAFLVYIAITEASRRYVNIVVVLVDRKSVV